MIITSTNNEATQDKAITLKCFILPTNGEN